MMGSRHILLFGIALLAVVQAQAQTRTLVIGGENGIPWADLGERVVGLDDTTVVGALQPFQLRSDQNILLGPPTEADEPTNFFGYKWSLNKLGRGEDFELGVNPRFWTATTSSIYHGGPRRLIDGDPFTVIRLINVCAGCGGRDHLYTFDFGFPLPVSRVRFYPPDRGIDEAGGLIKQRFPRAYEVSGALTPEDFLLVGEETSYHTLDKVLAQTFVNDDRVIDLQFEPQLFRFLRISFNLVTQSYLLGEIEVFGEGFPPVTSYRTVVADLGEPVNFGRVFYKFSKFRQELGSSEVVADPDAPISLVLSTRTGKDETPKKYHVITEILTEEEVDLAAYNRAPESSIRLGARPGDKGSVQEDEANWSAWSTPYRFSGEQIRSPDGRRFYQLDFRMESQEVGVFGRIDSIAIEYSPLLVEEIVGEVGVVDGVGLTDFAQAPVGVDTTFVYDLKAQFGAGGRLGFDTIRLTTLDEAEFVKLEIGEPLQEIAPDSVRQEADGLAVFFPSNKVSRTTGSERLRLTYRTSLLSFTTHFLGEISELGSQNLPQSVEPGDANPELVSNDIRVFAENRTIDVLAGFQLSSPVVTPNGDGANDTVDIDLTLLGVELTNMEVGVYGLDGTLVRSLVDEVRSRGQYVESWDGLDEGGAAVSPGVYLLRVNLDTDRDQFEQIRLISVAY
ncbi:MAG: hypothetical protein GKR89_24660 [Candidatus Latescibacteria bacterium]|nr:hypothetical protein [Candidatus Latescibacterota bacterium]